MTSERWEQVRRLFFSALDRPQEERSPFLDAACPGDPQLRQDVDALLAAHAASRDFLEAPDRAANIAAVMDAGSEAPALSPGRRLGPYEVVELLDAGGMGEVYRARDVRLGRDVALKVVRPHLFGDAAALSRFESEARVAGAISDPNVVAVFDVGNEAGTPYVISELLEGETLGRLLRRGSPGLEASVDAAVQIADGLAAAHAKGVVHRDLKPDNVFVTRQGRMKILDFGIAKLLDDSRGAGHDSPGADGLSSMLGTPGYIAPERIQGRAVDHRADIFALGAVLYQMLTGRTVSAASVAFTPGDGVPRAIERVVVRCLAEKPEDRFSSALDVRTALLSALEHRSTRRRRMVIASAAVAAAIAVAAGVWGLRPANRAAPAPIRSLAILPLRNASGEPDQEYFADGITEALIQEMARTPGLRVISRSSVMEFKNHRDLPDVARRLNVDAALEGSVARSGERMRVALALVRLATGEHVWTGAYDRSVRDVPLLQEEVARAITTEIALAPRVQNDPRPRHEPGTAAYEAYLRGRHFWNMRSGEAAPRAIEQFNQALSLDPLYAPAYAGLADTYLMLGDMLYLLPHRDAFARAEAAALRAIALDPAEAAAYASLGHIRMHEWQWEEAERAFARALELNPGYASAHQWRAYNFASLGRVDDSIAAIERAQQLDPLSLIINADHAQLLYFSGRYEAAVEQCRKTQQMAADFPEARRVSFLALERLHSNQEALAAAQAYHRHPDGGPGGSVGYAYAVLGRRADALAVLDELAKRSHSKAVPAYDFAAVYAGLGDRGRAFSWLDKSLGDGDPESMILPVDPRLDTLRGDPRFGQLLERMGVSPK